MGCVTVDVLTLVPHRPSVWSVLDPSDLVRQTPLQEPPSTLDSSSTRLRRVGF